jgi:hypothetical protein
MRFIELFITAAAAIVVTHAAPTGVRDVNMVQNVPSMETHKIVFDPKTMKRRTSRRIQQLKNKHQKRHKPCCDTNLDFNIGARLDVAANVGGPAANPAPVVPYYPYSGNSVDHNNRGGDSVVVIVDADHN